MPVSNNLLEHQTNLIAEETNNNQLMKMIKIKNKNIQKVYLHNFKIYKLIHFYQIMNKITVLKNNKINFKIFKMKVKLKMMKNNKILNFYISKLY